jgi:hypothetical protein
MIQVNLDHLGLGSKRILDLLTTHESSDLSVKAAIRSLEIMNHTVGKAA